MWSLRLRAAGGAAQTISVDPASTSTAQLLELVKHALGGPDVNVDALLAGIPPAALTIADTVMLNSTALEDRSVITVQCPATATNARPRKRGSARSGPATTEDLGALLAGAHARGARGSQAKKFRKATRQALVVQEELERSNARYAAALAGKFSISLEHSGRLGAGSGASNLDQIKVQYGKNNVETHPLMDAALVRGVVMETLASPAVADMTAHPRERLRPAQMALHSPAVFWNVVRLQGVTNLDQALCDLAPNADLRFLKTRSRKPSAKARENAEQRRALYEDGDDDQARGDDDGEDALAWAFESSEDRELLRSQGVTAVERLADLVDDNGDALDARLLEDHVELARVKLIEKWMLNDVLSDAALASRLAQLNVRTPMDVSKLRVPGRTEFVMAELDLPDRSVVDAWRAKADALLVQHAWLSQYRTAG